MSSESFAEASLASKRELAGPDDSLPKRRFSNAQQDRALKACMQCRRSKTKCFKISKVAVCCVRCRESNQECSLELEYRQDNPDVNIVDGVPEHLVLCDIKNNSFSINLMPKLQQSNMTLNSQVISKLDEMSRDISQILARVSAQEPQDLLASLNKDANLLLDAVSAAHLEPISTQPLASAVQDFRTTRTPLASYNGKTPHRFDTPARYPSPLLTQSQIDGRTTLMTASPDDKSVNPNTFLSSAKLFNVSPLLTVTKAMKSKPRFFAEIANLSLNTMVRPVASLDIISARVLSMREVIALMDDFRSNYGRWVLFPSQVSTTSLIDRIRKKSSLLLSTCCSISMRFLLIREPASHDLLDYLKTREGYKKVLQFLVSDLKKAVTANALYQNYYGHSGDIEFLQSIVILSIYLMSLSSIISGTFEADNIIGEDDPLHSLTLDPWHLSSLGLTNFITKTTFGSLFTKELASSDQVDGSSRSNAPQELTTFDNSELLTAIRAYNHLILIHLVSCILTGRMCVVDEIRLNYCMSALSLPDATNFDGRMVSEIGILLITYNYIQVNHAKFSEGYTEELDINLKAVNNEVQAWYDQWEYLFEQPTLQFVEFCYHFCCLQILYNYISCKVHVPVETHQEQEEFSSFTDANVIVSLLKHSGKDDLIKITAMSFNLINSVKQVEDDSYFAYLSDQIHFCFFYGAISFLTVLRYLTDTDCLHYLDEINNADLNALEWQKALEPVKLILEKYQRVTQDNPHDILTKYRSAIFDLLQELFGM